MRKIKIIKKELAINILLLTFVLLILFIGTEIILRVFFPIPTYAEKPYSYQLDPELGYKLLPYVKYEVQQPESSVIVETNKYGFRDKDYSMNEIDNTDFLILGLGDSFTFGAYVEENETFLNILEEELNKQNVNSIVVNAGLGGYGIIQEHRVAKKYVPIFKPDIVVLNYFIGNDIRDDHNFNKSDEWFLVDGYLVASESRRNIFYKINKNLNHLYIYKYIKRILSGNPIAYKIVGLIRKNKRLTIDYDQFTKEYSPEMNEDWLRTRNELEQLNNYLKSKNIIFVIVIIPSQPQINEDVQKLVALSSNMELDDFDFRKVNKLLEEFCNENDIILIDTTSFMEEDPVRYYFKLDGHWNREGHKLAGKIIFNQIINKIQNVKK